MDLDESLTHGKKHFAVIAVKFGFHLVVIVSDPGEIVGTEGDIVSGRSNRFTIGR